jgi:hypothetical protein
MHAGWHLILDYIEISSISDQHFFLRMTWKSVKRCSGLVSSSTGTAFFLDIF